MEKFLSRYRFLIRFGLFSQIIRRYAENIFYFTDYLFLLLHLSNLLNYLYNRNIFLF